jgi:hypothetical protein
MGLVKSINIFNNDLNRGAIIIEYFEDADPGWLSDPHYGQGLGRGDRPFFGIFYRVIDHDTVQMANAVDLAALYAGKHYYVEQETLKDAESMFDVIHEAEFISWGVVMPQERK